MLSWFAISCALNEQSKIYFDASFFRAFLIKKKHLFLLKLSVILISGGQFLLHDSPIFLANRIFKKLRLCKP
jgi:hypothetical protein